MTTAQQQELFFHYLHIFEYVVCVIFAILAIGYIINLVKAIGCLFKSTTVVAAARYYGVWKPWVGAFLGIFLWKKRLDIEDQFANYLIDIFHGNKR